MQRDSFNPKNEYLYIYISYIYIYIIIIITIYGHVFIYIYVYDFFIGDSSITVMIIKINYMSIMGTVKVPIQV